MGKGSFSEDKACTSEAVFEDLVLDDGIGELKMHQQGQPLPGWDTPRLSFNRGTNPNNQMMLNLESPCNSKQDGIPDMSLDIHHTQSHNWQPPEGSPNQYHGNFARYFGGSGASPDRSMQGKEAYFGATQDKFHNLGYGDTESDMSHPAPSVAIEMIPAAKKRKTEGLEPTNTELEFLHFASGISSVEQGFSSSVTSVERGSVSGELSDEASKTPEHNSGAQASNNAEDMKAEGEDGDKPHSEATEEALQSMGLSRRGLLKIPQAIQVLASEGEVLKANGDGSYTVLNGAKFEEEFNSLRVTRSKKNDGAKDRPFSRMSKHFELLQGEKWARTGSVFVPRAKGRGKGDSEAPSPVQESISAPNSTGQLPVQLIPRSASAPEPGQSSGSQAAKSRPPPLDGGNVNLASSNIHASKINIDLKDSSGRTITCTLQQFLDVTGAAEVYKRALTVRHGRNNMSMPQQSGR